MAQPSKQDLHELSYIHSILTKPEVRTVKTGGYRNAPLHQQLIDESSLDFAADIPNGNRLITVKPKQGLLDAIQGLTSRNARDNYGDATLKAT